MWCRISEKGDATKRLRSVLKYALVLWRRGIFSTKNHSHSGGSPQKRIFFGWNVHEMTGPYGFIRLMNHYLSSTIKLVFEGSIPKTWWDCDAKMSMPCCAQKIWKYMFLNRATGNWNRWALNSLYIYNIYIYVYLCLCISTSTAAAGVLPRPTV